MHLDFNRSAEKGDASGQNSLGRCYHNNKGVGRQDYVEAVKWYRLAARQGNNEAQNGLGACYQNGWGVEKNVTEALKWHRLSAAQVPELVASVGA